MKSNSSCIETPFLNNQSDTSLNETLISTDEYINEILPPHLEKLFLDYLEQPSMPSEASEEAIKLDSSMDSFDGSILQRSIQQLLQQEQELSGGRSISSSFSSWSFAQGLIVGQITVVVALIFFIKFFIFSDSSSDSNNPKNPPRMSSASHPFLSPQLFSSIMKRGGKDQVDVTDDIETERCRQIDSILEKTYYDVDTHSSESLDWFNVLIAQTIQQFREEAWQKDNIVHSLNDFIERKAEELPSYLDSIKITELDIGDDFPIFSNCRIQYSPNSSKKKLEAKIDIDLNDRLAVGVDTKLLLNYPKPGFASLPINVTVAIIRFQACLTVSLIKAEEVVPRSTNPKEENNETGYFLIFSFSPEYRMEFETESLIGARSKLENIPKIGSLIEYQIKKWFVERCVEPRFQFVKLPGMWPRSKNTREGKSDLDEQDSAK